MFHYASAAAISEPESEEPLIEKEEDTWHLRKRYVNFLTRSNVFIVVEVVSMVCLLGAAYLLGRFHGKSDLPKLPTDLVTSPGYQLHLQYLDDEFELEDPQNFKYKGLPRPELDQAWSELINDMNIRVHRDEIASSHFASVELNDGSGDVAAMPTVFHSLHCLKTLRHMQFPDSYPDWELFKPRSRGEINPHVDHCIDNIRQALMCQGDLSLYHYEWIPGRDKPLPVAGQEHICVDWSKVMEWTRARRFDITAGLFTNPSSNFTWIPGDE